MPPPGRIPAPIPQRNPLLATPDSDLIQSLQRPGSSMDFVHHVQKSRLSGLSRTPDPSNMQDQAFRNSQDEVFLKKRLSAYDLDYPEDTDEYLKAIVDKDSKWFSRKELRKLKLNKAMPYKTETHIDQANHLSHIVVHLYIAIKSLDLEGYVHISAKDLAAVKNDAELALETDIFNADMLSMDADDLDQDVGDDEEEEVRSSGVIGKALPRSATIVSVNHWTNELKSCLTMGFELPISLRSSLAKVYYSICLARGQDLKLGMFTDMFTDLVNGYRSELKDIGLVLDHHGLLAHYTQFFPGPDPTFDAYNPLTSETDEATFLKVLKVGMYASHYFKPEALEEIFDWALQRYSTTTSRLSLQVLSHTLPPFFVEGANVADYLPSIFHFWTNAPASKKGVEENNVIHLLSRLSSMNFILLNRGEILPSNTKKYGIYTEDQMKFLLHRLLGNLRQEFHVRSYSQLSTIMVCSITPENFDDFFELFKTLVDSLETFVHPSNQGGWSSPIAKFCFKFIHRYHKRVRDESEPESKLPEDLKVTARMSEQITDVFTDLLLLGSQSKKESHSNYYVSALGHLADLHQGEQNKVVDKILVDLYDSLTDQFVNSTHRIIVSLKQYTEVVRFMVLVPVYKVHITNILSLIISKIGNNDMTLTNIALNAFITTVSIIPVKDCTTPDDFISFDSNTIPFIQEHVQFIKEFPSDSFVTDDTIVHTALLASTSQFQEIVTSFIGKIMLLLEAELNEKISFKLTQTILIATQSMSDEIFQHVNKIIHDRLLSGDFNDFEDSDTVFANMIAAMVMRDHTLAKQYFQDVDTLIRFEISQGAGSVRNNTSKLLDGDVKLVLYLIVLSEILSVSNEHFVGFSEQAVELIFFLHEKVTNPSLASTTAYVLHKTLKNLTNSKLKESRLFKVEPSAKEALEKWGAYQFDERRFDEDNFDFDWYVPGQTEVQCAIDLFERVAHKSLSVLDTIISDGELTELSAVDNFVKNTKFIASALSGASMLFDPDFNCDTSESLNRSALENKLLILKSLRSSKSDGHELNIDIEQTANKDDNLDFVEADKSVPSIGGEHSVQENSIDQIISDSDSLHLENVQDDDLTHSAFMTPTGTHDTDVTSVMNPAIAFSEQKKIYNCGYVFGATAIEKKQSALYAHIHSLRTTIGQSLHKIYVFLSEQKSENAELFQSYLQVLRTYFSDVGKECTFDVDDQVFIDFIFMKRVLAAGNHDMPYTRTCFAARVEKFHRQRVILHSTNRFPSKLDKILLSDLVAMSTSSYETTNTAALLALLTAMRKIIGSYGLLAKSMVKILEEVLEKDDIKRIEACLKVFLLSKISTKLSSDYTHMKTLFVLFDRCLRHTEQQVSSLAKTEISLLSVSIKVPSAIALFDHAAVDAIRPPDKFIDMEITTVKAAKDAKRITYIDQLEELQDAIVDLIKDEDHWMFKYRYLVSLAHLQSYYELSTKESVLKLFVTQAKGHPTLVRHCIQSFSKIMDKILCFSLFQYNMENTFRLNYMRPGMIEIDTSNGFTETFKSEMGNFDNPGFFFDGRAHSGFLFWGKKLVALSSEKSYDLLELNDYDKSLLRSFGSMVTKDWMAEILKSVTIHNESASVFQVSEISLISSVVVLHSLGYSSIKYQDIIDIINDVYDKDDKASVIICAELICGLLVSSNHTLPEDIKTRDDFLEEFLDQALTTNLTPETKNVWNIIAWWLPTRVDFRRIPVLHKKFSQIKEFVDPTSNQAFVQSARLAFTRSYIANIGWQLQSAEEIMNELVFTHPYLTVRHQVSEILGALTYCFINSSFTSSEEFQKANSSDLGMCILDNLPASLDTKLKEIFTLVNEARQKIEGLTPQEAVQSDYFYLVTVILDWMRVLFGSPLQLLLVPYLSQYLIPFIMDVETHREMCKIGNISLDMFIQYFARGLFCRPDQIPDIISVGTDEYTSAHQLLHQLSFIEGFFNRQLLLMSTTERHTLLARVDSLMFHISVEVRTRASKVLTGMIHSISDLGTIETFIEKYKKIIRKSNAKKELTNEKMIRLHGATLGLGALISAFPYASPPPSWMPDQIVLLAKASTFRGAPGKSAKDALSNFKKLRADTWHIDRYSFTEDQLGDLEGVLSRSYFA